MEKVAKIVSSVSVGVALILTVIFCRLKFHELISWSWLWVLSPMWIVLGTAVVVAVIIIYWALIATLFKINK